MSAASDSQWLNSVISRSPGYEYEAVELYSKRLLQLANSRLPDNLRARIDAADVVQSAMRSFFSRNEQGNFTLDEAADIWRLLAAITYRKVQQSVRFHNQDKRDVKQENCLDDRFSDTETTSPTASSLVALDEITELLVKQLPATHQSILQMRLEGHSISEIAQQLNISTRTVDRGISLIRKLAAELFDVD